MTIRVYGNRTIKTLPGLATRPTTARVREAIFNIWQGTIPGCHWLDLCAGSGAMGAEALGRGAQSVMAIESSSRVCRILRENWQKIASDGQSFKVLCGDVKVQLKNLRGQKFERIYCDPPYEGDLYEPVLEMICQFKLLTPGGEIALEHDPKRHFLPQFLDLEICREKVYGNTALTFYQWNSDQV